VPPQPGVVNMPRPADKTAFSFYVFEMVV